MFVIEDELHSETTGQFSSREEAMMELRRVAALPWDAVPNQAPCRSWQTCGRSYELVEYDTEATPWREVSRERILDISSAGPRWLIG
ncbi:hypothetical protein [Methylobacterium sp. R2-1]|uniref:hypothetical protein n=1 Tax=Methylobacterium sp. R2-1 TaxID=2587064 RepID=UPI00180C8599|nr:hypothetical protein [Methylobacterium sp. R2-1]MBB2964665.1 hypothetical protein [Methylobacterium sp. R2-1]